MLGVFLYALFFYKLKITLRNVFLAKLLTNIQNVLLGALWMAILSGKAWYVTASGSVIKKSGLPAVSDGAAATAHDRPAPGFEKKCAWWNDRQADLPES